MEFYDLRHKYDIIKSNQNIMDIKLQFCYTLLLNQTIVLINVTSIFLQIFYEKIGPNNAFELWWSVFLFETSTTSALAPKEFPFSSLSLVSSL